MDIKGLTAQESFTDRLRRTLPEPHRSNLFAQVSNRVREVRVCLGSTATTEDLMAEIYMLGVHDGGEMARAVDRMERKT